MNNVISFTPSELVAFIGTIAGVCAGIATIVGVICKVVMRLKAPEVEQNNRIKALEEENKSRKEEIVIILFWRYNISKDGLCIWNT